MKQKMACAALLLASCSQIEANESYWLGSPDYWQGWRVKQYFHNSEMQRQWAAALFARNPFVGNENILDLGCRDGKISAQLSLLVPQGNVVAIDNSSGMIDFAKRKFQSGEYPNLKYVLSDFKDYQTDLMFDAVTSICSFHLIEKKAEVLAKIKTLLKPNGRFFINVTGKGNPGFGQAYMSTILSAKWSSYFKDYVWPIYHLSEDEWKELLSENGFSVKKIQTVQTLDPFYDRQELAEWFAGTLLPAVQIPDGLHLDFCKDLVDAYLSIHPNEMDQQGTIYIHWHRLDIEATAQ